MRRLVQYFHKIGAMQIITATGRKDNAAKTTKLDRVVLENEGTDHSGIGLANSRIGRTN